MLNICVSCPVIPASGTGLLYVKCLWELSRYHSPVVEVCYMLNVCVELSRYHSPVVEVCYMLNVCVSCHSPDCCMLNVCVIITAQ